MAKTTFTSAEQFLTALTKNGVKPGTDWTVLGEMSQELIKVLTKEGEVKQEKGRSILVWRKFRILLNCALKEAKTLSYAEFLPNGTTITGKFVGARLS